MMNNKKRVLLLVITAVFLLAGCSPQTVEEYLASGTSTQTGSVNETSEDSAGGKSELTAEGTVKLHFIDVGQGDATLIQAGDAAMLIDAGENNQGETVVAYLQEAGVTSLDYVIGTHPHSDHIGGLDTVILNMDVREVILPDKIHTSRTFEDVLDAVEEKGLSITMAEAGQVYSLGEAEFTIIAPASEYGDNLNNWSVGIRLIHGNNRFVFTGDAEQQAESDMLGTGLDLSAEVLHVGHHGSSTSSSERFVNAVNPRYAVISSGEDNMYGHPHVEILERLKSIDVMIYRTDESGTILLVSDGDSLEWSVQPSVSMAGGSASDETAEETQEEEWEVIRPETEAEYVINKNTRKIHLSSCSSAAQIQSENYEESDEKESWISQGYEACKRCNP